MEGKSLLLRAMHSGINEQGLKNTLEKFDLTLNGRNSETKTLIIIRRCQNSRLVEGFHSPFDESVVAPLFMPFLAYMGPFLVIFWVLEVAHSGTFLPKYAHGSEKDWEKRKFTGRPKMSFCL